LCSENKLFQITLPIYKKNRSRNKDRLKIFLLSVSLCDSSVDLSVSFCISFYYTEFHRGTQSSTEKESVCFVRVFDFFQFLICLHDLLLQPLLEFYHFLHYIAVAGSYDLSRKNTGIL